MSPFQSFSVVTKMRAFQDPWAPHDQTWEWLCHLIDSYQSPRQGRGRSHSYHPTQHQRYSSILVWWRWGPGHYHRDWHRWDYSSILSFLLWVALPLHLNRTEKVKRMLLRNILVSKQSRGHSDKKDRWVRSISFTKSHCPLSAVDSSIAR